MPPIKKEINYEDVKTLVVQSQNTSIAFLQRNLWLGYGAALALMDRLQADGVVTKLDEHGYRRLTPVFEKVSTEVSNNWRIFPDTENALIEGELQDVSSAVAAIRPYSPDQVAFYQELGFPCVELTFADIIKPETVIHIGLDLEFVLQMPVYLSNLQIRKVEYVVEGDFLLPDGASYTKDHLKSVRMPLSKLARIWNIDTVIEL